MVCQTQIDLLPLTELNLEQACVPRKNKLEIAINLRIQRELLESLKKNSRQFINVKLLTNLLKTLDICHLNNKLVNKSLDKLGDILLKIEIESLKLVNYEQYLKTSPTKYYVHEAMRNEISIEHPLSAYLENKGQTPKVNQAFHLRYNGRSSLKTAYGKYIDAKNLLTIIENKEKKLESSVLQKMIDSLQKIVKHREILFNYICIQNLPHFPDQLESLDKQKTSIKVKLNTLRSMLLKNIEELNNPASEHVIHINEHITSFTFPSSSIDHYMQIEFRKEGSHYYLIIYNRGSGLEDLTIHGKNTFYKDGKHYYRTDVKIAVSLEHLKNEQFLTDLLCGTLLHHKNSTHSIDKNLPPQKEAIEPTYQAIKTHLLDRGATIILANEEHEYECARKKLKKRKKTLIKEIENRIYKLRKESYIYIEKYMYYKCAITRWQQQINAIKSEIITSYSSRINNQLRPLQEELRRCEQKLIESSHFRAIQLYGTCLESNQQSSEKNFSTSLDRTILKLYSLQNIVVRLSYSHSEDSRQEEKDRHFLMTEHAPKKINYLKNKIKQLMAVSASSS